MSKFVILLLSFPFLSAACTVTPSLRADKTVQIKDATVNVQVAETSSDRMNGLSGIKTIAPNEGMLFLFPEPGRYQFWMKDMNFAIDIIWIRDNKIVDLSESVPTEPGKIDVELKLYEPRVDADSVLEVGSGWCAQNNIALGDQIKVQP